MSESKSTEKSPSTEIEDAGDEGDSSDEDSEQHDEEEETDTLHIKPPQAKIRTSSPRRDKHRNRRVRELPSTSRRARSGDRDRSAHRRGASRRSGDKFDRSRRREERNRSTREKKQETIKPTSNSRSSKNSQSTQQSTVASTVTQIDQPSATNTTGGKTQKHTHVHSNEKKDRRSRNDKSNRREVDKAAADAERKERELKSKAELVERDRRRNRFLAIQENLQRPAIQEKKKDAGESSDDKGEVRKVLDGKSSGATKVAERSDRRPTEAITKDASRDKYQKSNIKITIDNAQSTVSQPEASGKGKSEVKERAKDTVSKTGSKQTNVKPAESDVAVMEVDLINLTVPADEEHSSSEEADESEEETEEDEDEEKTSSEDESSEDDEDESDDEEEENDDAKPTDGAVDDVKGSEELNGIENGDGKILTTVEPMEVADEEEDDELAKLPPYYPAIQGCRNVELFQHLNRIEEGTYGVVYRAREKRTGEIVALKRLKMEKEKEGFPITSLREINTLLKAQHVNIVTVREIVVGSNMDKIYIVMDYVEHDLKSLMETMKEPFLLGEVKTLMIQLLRAVAHLHDNWILHRDLKTSNLLLSHKGVLKVGDFGLAREYGSPLKPYTPIVVTLWYRSPELLLGIKEYSTAVDVWSTGCIMGELLTMKPFFPGKSEADQLMKIFKDLGTPSEKVWPGYNQLPLALKLAPMTIYPYSTLRGRLPHNVTDVGFDLVNQLLTYCPAKRISAEDALQHQYFLEAPLPVPPSMFPTWPAKSELGANRRNEGGNSPKPPSGGKQWQKQLGSDDDDVIANQLQKPQAQQGSGGFHMGVARQGTSSKGHAFSLKF